MLDTLRPDKGIFILALVVLGGGHAARAINNGQPDVANEHSNVGAIIVETKAVGTIPFCSGTLIDDRAFLTAGHCTAFIDLLRDQLGYTMEDVHVSFDPHDAFDSATWHDVESMSTHPDFAQRLLLSSTSTLRNDVGLVVLDQPVVGITPAELAPVGFLDDLSNAGVLSRKNRSEFTVVGYGSIRLFPEPVFLPPDGQRRFATAEFQNLRAQHLQLNQIQAPGIGNGGTSFGDSGGPAFWLEQDGTRILTSVTSSGDAQAVASDVRQRIDIATVRDYLDAELISLGSVAAAIPEPSTGVLVSLALVCLLAGSRTRRRFP